MEKLDADQIGQMQDFALHFRHNSKVKEIETEGIKPAIGQQSKMGGKIRGEKFPKVCVSIGLEGGLRTVNRFLTAGLERKIGVISKTIADYATLPGEKHNSETGKVDLSDRTMDYKLNPTNPRDVKDVFDIMEKFYKARTYYIIPNFKKTAYEKNMTDGDMEEINNSEEICEIRKEVKKAYGKLEEGESTPEMETEALEAIKKMRESSVARMSEKRGAVVDEGMYDEYEFSDANLEIRKQGSHNIYTKTVEDRRFGYTCVPIKPDQIRQLTVHGKDVPALDVIRQMAKQKDSELYYTVYPSYPKMFEAPVVELFAAYTAIPEEQQEQRQAMAEKIAEYYKAFKEKVTEIKDCGIRATDSRAIKELHTLTTTLISDITEGRDSRGLDKLGVWREATNLDVARENENTNREFAEIGKTEQTKKPVQI